MPNALAQSSSPYLRQHAHNPVAWREWSTEAFAEARARDCPVLVSIGYSTCHWCHVMAHECFEDEETAALMNAAMVCIKVDREELPEVDAIYMDAVQALHGHGGWPLNAFVDHEGRPFYVCTYLPADRWRMLIEQLRSLWTGDRERIARAARDITAHIADTPSPGGVLGDQVWQVLAQELETSFDPPHPGYGWNPQRAPKFPPSQLLALLLASADGPLLSQAEAVLEAMQDSGLHERVGGGFHRYSVDRAWRVPHFEKMLYDNAQLITAYARAGALLERPDFLRTAAHTADYLLRDMTVPGPAGELHLASAEDADDPGGEGSFYAWSPAQLQAVIGTEAGTSLATDWDITPGRAIHGPSGHPEPIPSHIPHPRGGVFARWDAEQRQAARSRWEPCLAPLRAARASRPRPSRDDKVLTDQNGLALEAFATLAGILGDERYRDATAALARTIRARHTAAGLERLAGRPAYITDYGQAVAGLTTAFAVLGDPALIDAAMAIAQEAVERLRAEDGGFYSTPAGRADLIRRSREQSDLAYPAGGHALAVGMVRLWNITGEGRWRALAEGIFSAAAARAQRHPSAMATLLLGSYLAQRGHRSVLVQGEGAAADALLACARADPDPGLAILPARQLAGRSWTTLAPAATPASGAATAIVCRQDACLAPAGDPTALRERLAEATDAPVLGA